jgi:aldose 1-epimerase
MLALRRGGAVLDLLPEVGGAIARFAVDGSDVLRPAAADTRDVLATGCFPLVPFANRIAHGVFTFAGETVRLPPNFADHPHPLHGGGWQGRWTVRSLAQDSAVLAFEHPPGAWPWSYAAEQAFQLTVDSLRVALTLTNLGDRAMPFSCGFHPYFPRTPKTVIRANVSGVWLADSTCIPTITAAASHFLDLQDGAPLITAGLVDHCHFGWHGGAVIEQPELLRALVLTASPELPFLHLYIPNDADFFCVEPVSAMPNAFNHDAPAAVTGLREIAPGESHRVAMTLAVRARQ